MLAGFDILRHSRKPPCRRSGVLKILLAYPDGACYNKRVPENETTTPSTNGPPGSGSSLRVLCSPAPIRAVKPLADVMRDHICSDGQKDLKQQLRHWVLTSFPIVGTEAGQVSTEYHISTKFARPPVGGLLLCGGIRAKFRSPSGKGPLETGRGAALCRPAAQRAFSRSSPGRKYFWPSWTSSPASTRRRRSRVHCLGRIFSRATMSCR